jgi:hypothetical protein
MQMSTFDEVISRMSFDPLPEGWTPLSAAFVVKCLDEDGNAGWSFRTSADMNDEELLGALIIRTEILKQNIVSAYEIEDE